MSFDRLPSYLQQMLEAATEACMFTADIREEDFLADRRTQMAVTMTFVLLGETAARIASHCPEFIEDHPEIPWAKIRGLRNLIAYEYQEIDFPVIWQTTKTELPKLIAAINSALHWRAQGE